MVDDVWQEAQLRPFLRGGPNCVRLVTTRVSHVLPKTHRAIDVDEMGVVEAKGPHLRKPANRRETRLRGGHLAALAERLGYWAQMLKHGKWLDPKAAFDLGEKVENAVVRFEDRLEKRGLTAFDPTDERERNRAIRACVEASLDARSNAELNVLRGHENWSKRRSSPRMEPSSLQRPGTTRHGSGMHDRLWNSSSCVGMNTPSKARSSPRTEPASLQRLGIARHGSGMHDRARNSASCAGMKAGCESAGFSPDGTRIVTASRDGAARIWDVVSGIQVGTMVE